MHYIEFYIILLRCLYIYSVKDCLYSEENEFVIQLSVERRAERIPKWISIERQITDIYGGKIFLGSTIRWYFAFENKERARRSGNSSHHANHSRRASHINIRQFAFSSAGDRSTRPGHFQDGCRHFARYTPKVLLPTKFQLAPLGRCIHACIRVYIYIFFYTRRSKIRGIRHLLLRLEKAFTLATAQDV